MVSENGNKRDAKTQRAYCLQSLSPHTEKQTKQERLKRKRLKRQKNQLKEWWEFYSAEDLKDGNSDFSCMW